MISNSSSRDIFQSSSQSSSSKIHKDLASNQATAISHSQPRAPIGIHSSTNAIPVSSTPPPSTQIPPRTPKTIAQDLPSDTPKPKAAVPPINISSPTYSTSEEDSRTYFDTEQMKKPQRNNLKILIPAIGAVIGIVITVVVIFGIGMTHPQPPTLLDHGNALNDQGYYAQAIIYYDKALAIDPNYTRALNGKNYSLSHIGENASNIAGGNATG